MFPAHLTLKPYLATLPKLVGPSVMPRRKSDPSPAPPVTVISGDLSKEKRDLSLLGEPIHKLFVNWRPDLEGLVEFTKKFGVLELRCFLMDDEIQEDHFNIEIAEWRTKQEELQKWWDMNGRKDPGVLSEVKKRLGIDPPSSPEHYTLAKLQQDHRNPRLKPFELDWDYQARVLIGKIQVPDLYHYMCFLLMFQKLGSLRRCQNPDCAAPRFIAGRTDQIFCTTDCAALIAKRRWWAEHGNSWRKKNKKTKKKKAKRGKH
jgi:hypothetical protein